MSRWLGVLVASVTAVLYLFPVSGAAPPSPPAAPVEAVAPPAPAVRLQHQIITVTPSPSRPKPAKPNGHVRSARAVESRPARATTVVARAKRMLFGDGSHRPEPFPRPGRP